MQINASVRDCKEPREETAGDLCPCLLFLGLQSVSSSSFLLSPFLLFSSSAFPQFCHINMNLGLQRFRVPQAAACAVCLVYSSVTMVTDAWVFLLPLALLCLSTELPSPHICRVTQLGHKHVRQWWVMFDTHINVCYIYIYIPVSCLSKSE